MELREGIGYPANASEKEPEDDKMMRCEPGGGGSWRQELRPLRGAGGELWPQGPRS